MNCRRLIAYRRFVEEELGMGMFVHNSDPDYDDGYYPSNYVKSHDTDFRVLFLRMQALESKVDDILKLLKEKNEG